MIITMMIIEDTTDPKGGSLNLVFQIIIMIMIMNKGATKRRVTPSI